MRKAFIKYLSVSIMLLLSSALSAQHYPTVLLANDSLELEWKQEAGEYRLEAIKVKGANGWNLLEPAKYQHNVLYSSTKPDPAPQKLYNSIGKEILFPAPQYRYMLPSWKQNINAVALNKAGENKVYRPSVVEYISDKKISFQYEDEMMRIVEEWCLDVSFQNDIRVKCTLYPKTTGYYSLATPSLVSVDKYNFQWATIPGIFQGDGINPDFIQAYAYGQGIPNLPVVARERTASTLSALITDRTGITVAVTAEPGVGRNPWLENKKTQSEWLLGLSVMNRDGEFTPTLYHPVLGEKQSCVQAGDSISFSFRYTLQQAEWYTVLTHSINDIYHFADFLKLKQTKYSLTQRLYDMYDYLVNDSTSQWHNHSYKGTVIGAQDYLGGVYGSEKDAMKNSDYGAMWMLAKMTGDARLTQKRLPYALNFKLMQQHRKKGFLYGSSAGQYYLHKSKQFAEEWGPYTEPIATTYYMLMDMGNIFLFEPQKEELKQHIRAAADCLLSWMSPEGQWEVAYDNATLKPTFTDVDDLRPTFYGLLIAYQILKDEKYLKGAMRGADWYVEHAVKKGHFLGVCGDTRFVPDFATVQSAQALLELYDVTQATRYKEAALLVAKIYTTSVYTHPIPTNANKVVKGVVRKDWEISQVGLNFEHGGVAGSANHRGPILLASHAGMFVRMFTMTQDSLFLNMARAAAIGRDAFVDWTTGVASYYWDSMNNGAGPYPHHAWWQVGWITDYLLSEINLRSNGKITYPCGFMAPKVGPHKTYGFASGWVMGTKADLIMRKGLFTMDNPYMEYIISLNEKEKTVFLILLNNDDERQTSSIGMNTACLFPGKDIRLKRVTCFDAKGDEVSMPETANWRVTIDTYGLKVFKINYK